MATDTTTPSMAKETGDPLTMDNNRAYSNRDNWKDKHSNDMPKSADRVCTIMGPIYTMDIDREKNCYSCERFGHLVQNCRRWEIVGQGRRAEYENNRNIRNNLNREGDLIILD